jgi:hypothetical protein
MVAFIRSASLRRQIVLRGGWLRAARARNPALVCGVARKRACYRGCACAPYTLIMEFIQTPRRGLLIAVPSAVASALTCAC